MSAGSGYAAHRDHDPQVSGRAGPGQPACGHGEGAAAATDSSGMGRRAILARLVQDAKPAGSVT
jgi:hypothetical protein